MRGLLALSAIIDRVTEFIGKWVAWLILVSIFVSAGNAIVRKVFDTSSNAFLEIQWYLFAAVFLVAAGYTLMRQEHVKIDVVLHNFKRRTQVKIEIFGILAFLLPFVIYLIDLVWPLVTRAYVSGEMSQNAGGLIRWPVFALVPLGFALLGLQAVSELIKRIGYLMGIADDPGQKKQEKSAEEELVEEIRAHEAGAKP